MAVIKKIVYFNNNPYNSIYSILKWTIACTQLKTVILTVSVYSPERTSHDKNEDKK